MPRDILVCTIGTSLIGQANRLDPEHSLKASIENRNPQAAALALLELEPSDRTCGAEINSINSIASKSLLAERDRLVLLTSDTEDGFFVGKTLEHFFSSHRCPIHFDHVKVIRVEGMDDSNPQAFRLVGLRELVRHIGNLIKRYGAGRISINATGGYKAQISFAGLVGQALEVPVLYMFERFPDVIELPPQPVSLDFSLWLDNYELFRFLEKRRDVTPAELHATIGGKPDPRLKTLLEEIDDLVALSAVGELFHRQFTYRFLAARQRLLPAPAAPGKRRHPDHDLRVWNDHVRHLDPRGLGVFLRRVFEETPYLLGFHAYYTNPDLPKETDFRLGNVQNHQCVVLVYSDSTGTAYLEVELDTTSSDELKAAVADLNQRFS